MECRFCKNNLTHEFIDLNHAPPSNSFLRDNELNHPEVYYPLKVFVCEKCFLVQVDEFKRHEEIFNQEYAYFSSFSKTWLEHCKQYSEEITNRFNLTTNSKVVEIASNDGYLLQYFKEKKIKVLGIEPTLNTARKAKEKGIETIVDFFGERLARDLKNNKSIQADVIVGNNVLAHVPDINDFVKGLKFLLKDDGIITLEFPHLMELVKWNQFDTIYHEHFSYLSLFFVDQLFVKHELEIFDVDKLSTHGGSIRIYVKHLENINIKKSNKVKLLLEEECSSGINNVDYYKGFKKTVAKIKQQFLTFLLQNYGKKIIAYGAAAKGNTLLNFCGIKNDIIQFVVDASPFKQGKFLPGSHIPIYNEDELKKTQPDFVIILPWNIKEEIEKQLSYIREWGGKFVVPIPELTVY